MVFGLLYIVAFVFEGLYFMVFSLLHIVAFHGKLSKYTKGVSRNKYPFPKAKNRNQWRRAMELVA